MLGGGGVDLLTFKGGRGHSNRAPRIIIDHLVYVSQASAIEPVQLHILSFYRAQCQLADLIVVRGTHRDFKAATTSAACFGLCASKSYRFSAPSRTTTTLNEVGHLLLCLQERMEVAWNEDVFMLSKKVLLSVGMICGNAALVHARVFGVGSGLT